MKFAYLLVGSVESSTINTLVGIYRTYHVLLLWSIKIPHSGWCIWAKLCKSILIPKPWGEHLDVLLSFCPTNMYHAYMYLQNHLIHFPKLYPNINQHL